MYIASIKTKKLQKAKLSATSISIRVQLFINNIYII